MNELRRFIAFWGDFTLMMLLQTLLLLKLLCSHQIYIVNKSYASIPGQNEAAHWMWSAFVTYWLLVVQQKVHSLRNAWTNCRSKISALNWNRRENKIAVETNTIHQNIFAHFHHPCDKICSRNHAHIIRARNIDELLGLHVGFEMCHRERKMEEKSLVFVFAPPPSIHP